MTPTKTPKNPHMTPRLSPVGQKPGQTESAPINSEPYLSKKTLAKHLERSTRWIERHQAENGLPFIKGNYNEKCLYRISEVDAWLAQRDAARRQAA